MGNLVIASGETRLITANGSATIYNSSVDMSGFVGCKITVADGSGNELVAYGHGADDAEALGSELAPSFVSAVPAWTKSNALWTENDGNASCAGAALTGNIYNDNISFSSPVGKLMKWQFDVYDYSAGQVGMVAFGSLVSPPTYTYRNANGTYTQYRTETAEDGTSYHIYIRSIGTPTLKVRNVTVKQVTAIGTDALQLRDQAAESGSSRNVTSIDVGFNPNDVATITVEPMVAGSTSGITSNQATLTATVVGADDDQPVGIGFYDASDDSLLNTITELTGLSDKVHLATKDGEAMLFVDDVDLSSYAGSDDGNTPNMMIMEDSSGNICASFCGAVGGGEALGAELITSGDFSSGVGWITVYGASVASGVCTLPSNNSAAYRSIVNSIGQIVKLSIDVNTLSSGDSVRTYLNSQTLGYGNFTSTGANQNYYTTTTLTNMSVLVAKSGSVGSAIVDNFSAKTLTDVPVTGIHLISEPDGSTRNVAYKDTSFNPKTVVTIRIFSNFTHGNGSDAFDWTGLSPATSYGWYPKADNGVQVVTGETVNFETLAGAMSRLDGSGFNVPNIDNLMGVRGINGFNV